MSTETTNMVDYREILHKICVCSKYIRGLIKYSPRDKNNDVDVLLLSIFDLLSDLDTGIYLGESHNNLLNSIFDKALKIIDEISSVELRENVSSEEYYFECLERVRGNIVELRGLVLKKNSII